MTNARLTRSNGFIKVEGQAVSANPGPDATGPSSNGGEASSLLFREAGIIKTGRRRLFRMHKSRSWGRVQPSVKDGGRKEGRKEGRMDRAREERGTEGGRPGGGKRSGS